MVVWAVTVPVFWYVTLHNLRAVDDRLPAALGRMTTFARRHHGVALTIWFLLITAAVLQRFWLYWSTALG